MAEIVCSQPIILCS